MNLQSQSENRTFLQCLKGEKYILMEGALGERLKREYGLEPDPNVALASIVTTEPGRNALKKIWGQYISIAQSYHLPFLATAPTRRANEERIRLSRFEASILEDNVRFLRDIRDSSTISMYIGGLMGCKGDAYTGEGALNEKEALDFHTWQAQKLCDAGVDFLMAGLMPTVPEAIGMAKAMEETGLPCLISFTIQRNGRLIDGTSIHDAIFLIDSAVQKIPACYMTNCVHPAIVRQALTQPWNKTETVHQRFLGVQANTSPLSYAQLDGASSLHCTDPKALASEMEMLGHEMDLKIWGGCCGTDNRHMEEMAKRMNGTIVP